MKCPYCKEKDLSGREDRFDIESYCAYRCLGCQTLYYPKYLWKRNVLVLQLFMKVTLLSFAILEMFLTFTVFRNADIEQHFINMGYCSVGIGISICWLIALIYHADNYTDKGYVMDKGYNQRRIDWK